MWYKTTKQLHILHSHPSYTDKRDVSVRSWSATGSWAPSGTLASAEPVAFDRICRISSQFFLGNLKTFLPHFFCSFSFSFLFYQMPQVQQMQGCPTALNFLLLTIIKALLFSSARKRSSLWFRIMLSRSSDCADCVSAIARCSSNVRSCSANCAAWRSVNHRWSSNAAEIDRILEAKDLNVVNRASSASDARSSKGTRGADPVESSARRTPARHSSLNWSRERERSQSGSTDALSLLKIIFSCALSGEDVISTYCEHCLGLLGEPVTPASTTSMPKLDCIEGFVNDIWSRGWSSSLSDSIAQEHNLYSLVPYVFCAKEVPEGQQNRKRNGKVADAVVEQKRENILMN